MRAKELLAESGLTLNDFLKKNNHYWANLLKKMQYGEPIELTNGKTVIPTKDSYQQLKSIWDGSSLATPEQIRAIKSLGMQTQDGSTVGISNIKKTAELKSLGTKGGKEKFWNLGNVVEGILGAAVTAKFMSPDDPVTSDDIKGVIKSLQKVGSISHAASTKIDNDLLTYTLSLNELDFNAIKLTVTNPTELGEYQKSEEIFKAFENAATYANTSDTIRTAVDRVRSDPNSNKITIESEGGSAEKQSSTKADIFITIDGVRERLLSLKAGTTKQIGQVSGHGFRQLEAFFKSTVGFGLPNAMNNEKDFPKGNFNQAGETAFNRGFAKAYKHIYSALSQTLKGDSNYAEYNFIEQMYGAIRHHATLGEDVIIVYLSPSARKAYTELKIGPELRAALNEFDLRPVLASPTIIKVVGVPVTALAKEITGGKEVELLQLRSYTQKSSALRNIMEVGPLLKLLADVDKIKERSKQEPSKPASPAPTTAAPKPATPSKVKPVAPVKPS